jgi:hypothetical protein
MHPKDLKKRTKVNEVMETPNSAATLDMHRSIGNCLRTTSAEVRRRTAALSPGDSKTNWLQILNDYWIGSKNQYLCGTNSQLPIISAPLSCRSVSRL